jgi:hypothetical protein
LEFRGDGNPIVENIKLKIDTENVEYDFGYIKLYKDIQDTDFVHLRSSASNKNNKILLEIKDGERIGVHKERVPGRYLENLSDIWHEVVYRETRGFVLSSFVEIDGQERDKIIDLIKEKSNQYKVDANLMLAIAGCESRFKPYALSTRKCQGIFQLSVGAAEQMGVNDRYDIYQNIEGGIKCYKWIEKQIVGRGNILEKRLVAWQSGIGYVPKKGSVDYKKLPFPVETKKFVENVFRNIEKKNWQNIIWISVTIFLFVFSSFFLGRLFRGENIKGVFLSSAENATENLKLKTISNSIFFNQEHEGIKKIIVRGLRDKNNFPHTEIIYWNDNGQFKEILNGYFSDAGWIGFQYSDKIFAVEREEGKYLPTAFYRPIDGHLKKIKFIKKDGKEQKDISGPFEILSIDNKNPVLHEYLDEQYYGNGFREYQYDFLENAFKEI